MSFLRRSAANGAKLGPARDSDRGKNLLQAELDGDREMHRHGLPVERGGLVFPLAQCVHGRLMQE